MDMGIPGREQDPLKKKKRRIYPTQTAPRPGAFPTRTPNKDRGISKPPDETDTPEAEALRRRLRKRKIGDYNDQRAAPAAGQKGASSSGPYPGSTRIDNPNRGTGSASNRASMPARR